MGQENRFLPLLLIMGLAFVTPILAARVRWIQLPAVALELIFGIGIGESGLGLVRNDEVLSFLSTFGFAYLMFLSGLEIDFRRLRAQFRPETPAARGGSDLLRALVMFAATASLSFGLALVLIHMGIAEARALPLLALILCTTSVGVVMPVLRQGELTRRRIGQVVLLSAVIADMSTIVALSVVLTLMSNGPAWELALFAVLGLVLLGSVKLGNLLAKRGNLSRILSNLSGASTQIKVRGALALLLVFVAMVDLVGQEIILGAFMAGALVSVFATSEHMLLTHKLEALGYGFFVPLFFIMVGVSFDASVLTGGLQTLLLLGVLGVGAFLVKVIPALLAFTATLGLRKATGAGVLLSARLSLIIAISAIGLRQGLIPPEFNSAVILLALVTSILAPSLFGRIVGHVGRKDGRVVVAGAGRVGRALAHRLHAQNVPVLVVEKDPDQLRKLADDVPTLVGDATDPAVLARAGLSPQDAFVAVTGSDDVNLDACLLAQQEGGVRQAVARDSNPDSTQRFARSGVTPMNVIGTVALSLENLLLRPSLVHMLGTGNPDREAYEIRVARVPHDHRFVRDFHAFGDTLFAVFRRGNDIVIPHGDSELTPGTVIVAIGSEDERRAIEEILGNAPPESV